MSSGYKQSASAAEVEQVCPVCGGQNLTPTWTLGEYRVGQCGDCSHSFVLSGFSSEVLDQAYESDYYAASDSTERTGYVDYLGNAPQRLLGFKQRLHELERFTSERGRLLDFGCAVGLFVKVATDAGWEAIGLERSAWAADYGRRQFGLTIVAGSEAECADFKGRFDMVTMWDVLEHLEDPRGVLRQVAHWLKPGGVLALNTVDSASLGARLAGEHWRHLGPPHHLQYFTRDSLRHLLRETGFRVLTVDSQGVMWGADRRRKHVVGWRAMIERLATHWRTQPLAHRLHLLDEVSIVAIREAGLPVT